MNAGRAAEARKNSGKRGKGRTISRKLSSAAQRPFDSVEWQRRTCAITNDRGDVVFEQRDVEVPAFWSPMASNVVASKYLRGEINTPERESGVRALISRIVDTISEWGREDGYFADDDTADAFKDELTCLLLHQYASFNSPVWFNVGAVKNPQCSACFILSVDDSIESLLELQMTEAKLFKYGSGAGSNLSSIRSSREKLSGGGTPSGPVSFMRGFDAWAGTIKSGGKTRRAAKMQILNVTHPDIREFVTAKVKEEKKAWALIDSGYDGGFAVPGGAYDSVGFQNANLSVRVTDQFMEAAVAGRDYSTARVTDGTPCEKINAREMLRMIAEGTHLCGDPGLQFDTTINEWHTCPASGRINASNPCSEYMHLDNSACNLASLNLIKFLRDDGSFDAETFCHAVDIFITAQDILIDRSSYPTAPIGATAREYRQLGLGFANLGALLMRLGLPYDSDDGRTLAAAITALMTSRAYLTSAEIAEAKSAFGGFEHNREGMLKVIEKHCDAARGLPVVGRFSDLGKTAVGLWEQALDQGRRQGFRNSQVTVLAPTGTISFMMDCDTTGIEPDIALVKYKRLAGGGMLKIVNQSVAPALRRLGYAEEAIERITAYINEHDTIEGAPDLEPADLPVFDCAFRAAKGSRVIGTMGHLKMMAATQPFLSGAISKTVNLPKEVTVDEIMEIYTEAWRLGLKAVALYRDGSKRTQPLDTAKAKTETKQGSGPAEAPAYIPAPGPVRRRLPDERQAITHKFEVGGLEGYLTVGLFEDGSPGEIFLVVAKEGSTLSGVMDAFATSVSLALQYGVPLQALVRKFTYMRFEPLGRTHNKSIPMANSVVDYVFRWLSLRFLTPEERQALGLPEDRTAPVQPKAAAPVSIPGTHSVLQDNSAPQNSSAPQSTGTVGSKIVAFRNSEDAPPCVSCGSTFMVRQAGCYLCLCCGAQGGCG